MFSIPLLHPLFIFLIPQALLRTLFSITLKTTSSLEVRDQVIRLLKQWVKFLVLATSIYVAYFNLQILSPSSLVSENSYLLVYDCSPTQRHSATKKYLSSHIVIYFLLFLILTLFRHLSSHPQLLPWGIQIKKKILIFLFPPYVL